VLFADTRVPGLLQLCPGLYPLCIKSRRISELVHSRRGVQYAQCARTASPYGAVLALQPIMSLTTL
jgi:hypothetical protein